MSNLSPKEKAIEIYNSFRNENSVMAANVRAKKQAIACVNEILKSISYIVWENEGDINFKPFFDYFEEVKQEIEKL